MEYFWRDMIAARAGHRMNCDLLNLTYGAGLRLPIANARLRLDYALAAFGDFDDVHYYCFGIDF